LVRILKFARRPISTVPVPIAGRLCRTMANCTPQYCV
jgi:hypothetical protein